MRHPEGLEWRFLFSGGPRAHVSKNARRIPRGAVVRRMPMGGVEPPT